MVMDSIVSRPCRGLLLLATLGLTLAACGQDDNAAKSEPVSQVAQSSASGAAEVSGPQPVAQPITAQPATARSGEAVYQQVCVACHASGLNEAPKFGDSVAWAELIEEGYGVLVYESIKGEGMMPPRGGVPTLTDMEMASAVAYMANAAGADFVVPATDAEVKAMLAEALHAHEEHH